MVLARNQPFLLLWRESFITTRKKSSSLLSGGLCCCVSFWFWREIGSLFVVVGKFYYDRKKSSIYFVVAGKFYYDRKKRYSCLSGGCAIIITTGNKRYSRLSGGCAIIIMTGKKRYSRQSGGCAIMSVFLVAIIIFVLVQLELNLIQIR